MSLRAAFKFGLVAIVTLLVVGPVSAQAPNPWRDSKDLAPMPRQEPAGIRINVPSLGPLGLPLDYAVPLNKTPGDHKQLFSLSVGLFGGPLDEAPMPRTKSGGSIEIEFGIELGSGPRFSARGSGLKVASPAAPQPRTTDELARAHFDLFLEAAAATRPAPKAHFNVPALGPKPIAFDFCFPLTQTQAPVLNEMNFTWQYNGPPIAPQQAVPMPRTIVEIIGDIELGHYSGGGMLVPSAVFRPAPAMTPYGRTSVNPMALDVVWSNNGPNISAPRVISLPHAMVEVIGVETPGYCPPMTGHCGVPHPAPMMYAYPSGAYQSRMAQRQVVAHGNAPGGWWLHELPVPQPAPVMDAFQSCCPPQFVRPAMVNRIHPGTAVAAPIPSAPVASVVPGRFAGTWYRETEFCVFSATFSGDDMKVCMHQSAEGHSVCFTLTADYWMTKEGIVHGVITGVDVAVKRDPKQVGGLCVLPTEAIAAELQQLIDCPFSFRTKVTSAGVMVSHMKLATGEMGKMDLALVTGMYKPARDGMVPPAKPMNANISGTRPCDAPHCLTGAAVEAVTYPVTGSGLPMPPVSPAQPPAMLVPTMPTPVPPSVITAPEDVIRQIKQATGLKETHSSGITLPSPHYLQHPPQYLPPAPTPIQPWASERTTARTVTSCDVLPARLELAPSKPAHMPAGEFGMMADVFGQMFGGKSTAVAGPPPLPKATYLNQPPQYYPPPASSYAPRMLEPSVPPMPIPTLPVIERPTAKKKPPAPEFWQSPFGNFLY